MTTKSIVIGGLNTTVFVDVKDAPTTLEQVADGVVAKADALPPEEIPAPDNTQTTDLLSPEVPPGERVVTSVNLPLGWEPIGEFTLIGDAEGKFKVVASQLVGQTLKVMAENVSDNPARFSATFQYSKVLSDAINR